MQIIGDDDPVIAAAERPGRSVLEIDRDDRQAGIGNKRGERRDIAVGREDAVAKLAQHDAMPPATGGEVEDMTAWTDQRREAADPGRRLGRPARSCG